MNHQIPQPPTLIKFRACPYKKKSNKISNMEHARALHGLQSYFEIIRDDLAAGETQKLLKDRYIHAKGSDDEFEVIHIVCHDNKSLYNRLVTDVPWLLHLFGYSCVSELFPGTFGFCNLDGYDRHDEVFSMIAFDQDGRVVRKTISPSVEDIDFPFYAGSMEEETFSVLKEKLNWEYFDEAEQGIYSFKRRFR